MKTFLTTQSKKIYDITDIIIETKINYSVKSFKNICNITVINNTTSKLIKKNIIDIADLLEIKEENNQLFSGIIVKENESSKDTKSYIAYSYGWYLEKNHHSMYFENVNYIDALKTTLESYNLNLKAENNGDKCMITKFFKTKTLAGIINYIFKEYSNLVGKELHLEHKKNYFQLELTKKQKYIDGNYTPKEFFVQFRGEKKNIFDLTISKNQSKTFANLKNVIEVNAFENNTIQGLDLAADIPSIKKYGRLAEVVKFKYNVGQYPDTVAKNRLKLKNVIDNKLSLTLASSNFNITKGEIIKINDNDLGVNGIFQVSILNINFKNKNATMDMTLKEVIK